MVLTWVWSMVMLQFILWALKELSRDRLCCIRVSLALTCEVRLLEETAACRLLVTVCRQTGSWVIAVVGSLLWCEGSWSGGMDMVYLLLRWIDYSCDMYSGCEAILGQVYANAYIKPIGCCPLTTGSV